MQQENKFVEYKEVVSKTFLKVVSAFANYNDGKILFGVSDEGSVIGLSDPCKAAIDIENAINDSISPVPEYEITVNDKNRTVILNVQRGTETPYFYHGKAYRRSDTASVPVDTVELKRLVLKGTNRNYGLRTREYPPERRCDAHGPQGRTQDRRLRERRLRRPQPRRKDPAD